MNPQTDTASLRRVVSPSAVALTLMLLFLPFVGVACGPYEAEISGWDMIVGGEVTVTGADDGFEFKDGSLSGNSQAVDDVPVQPLMVMALLSLLVAALPGLVVRTATARAAGSLIATVSATFLIGVNEIVIMDDLVDEAMSSGMITRRSATEMVETRPGFWLTLLLLITLIAYRMFELTRHRHGAHPTPPPPHSPYPGQYVPPHPTP